VSILSRVFQAPSRTRDDFPAWSRTPSLETVCSSWLLRPQFPHYPVQAWLGITLVIRAFQSLGRLDKRRYHARRGIGVCYAISHGTMAEVPGALSKAGTE
jgi:hypothetical protein